MTTTAGEVRDDSAAAGDALEAPALLRIIWADPQHMPEQLAVWSLSRFGPRAVAAVANLRPRVPDGDRDGLEELVVTRQMRLAMAEGAFVGGPFIVLIPVAFCAALLAQAQMVFELAAAAGNDPRDEMRAADLLVLLGAYASTDAASAALAKMTVDPARHEGKRLPRGTRVDVVRRMAYLLGVLGTTDDGRTRLRNTLGWIGVGLLFLVGFVLPLVWVPYMAYSMRRSTIRLGERARTYYAASDASDAGVTVERRRAVRLGGMAALIRTTVLVVLPIVAAAVYLLTSASFGGGHWTGAGILLLGVSALATLAWFAYRRRVVR